MGRILGIDYGQKRTGLAVTDPLQIIVSPLDHVETDQLQEFLEEYFENEQVEELVIGYPVHKDGSKTYLCGEIDEFLVALLKNNEQLKITKTDESFSSMEGGRLLAQAVTKKKKRREKGKLDMYSAVIILRRYLGHI